MPEERVGEGHWGEGNRGEALGGGRDWVEEEMQPPHCSILPRCIHGPFLFHSFEEDFSMPILGENPLPPPSSSPFSRKTRKQTNENRRWKLLIRTSCAIHLRENCNFVYIFLLLLPAMLLFYENWEPAGVAFYHYIQDVSCQSVCPCVKNSQRRQKLCQKFTEAQTPERNTHRHNGSQ